MKYIDKNGGVSDIKKPEYRFDYNRFISAVIAVIYLVFAYYYGGGFAIIRQLLFILLPLACIWFSEAMGKYKSPYFGISGQINRESPTFVIRILGWLLFLMPVGAFIYWKLNGEI